MDTFDLLMLAPAFIVGTFIGSFLNVCIHRLPRNESVVMPPSRCYACGTRVGWYDNLPVLSWLWLRGRCRHCGSPYGVRYLVGELLVGLLTLGVCAWAFRREIPAPDLSWIALLGSGDSLRRASEAAVLLVFVWYAWVASAIDHVHTIIPDELTKPLQAVAPLLALGTTTGLELGWLPIAWFRRLDPYGVPTWSHGSGIGMVLAIGVVAVVLLLASLPLARAIYGSQRLGGQRWQAEDHHAFAVGVRWFAGVTMVHLALLALLALVLPARQAAAQALALAASQAVLGSLIGWGSLYLIGFLGTMAFRRNAMGYGDVKFLAPIGALLGPAGVVYAFFFAAVVGSLVGIPRRLLHAKHEIPFGPFLAIGAVLTVPLGPWLSRSLF